MAYDALFEQAGRAFNVDPALLKAQMYHESRGNPNAKSEAGAVGLMQLIPATQKALGVTDPTDPKQNIYAAARLMAENLDRYGNVADAVSAYHGGTDQSNWGPKTKSYANNVVATYTGAAPAGKSAAPDEEDFAALDFAVPQAKAAPDPDDFAALDFAEPKAAQAAQVATAAPSVNAAAPQPAPQDQGILSQVASGAGKYLEDTGAGAIEGVSRALDAPSEWLSMLDGTHDQQVEANKARRAAYDAQPGSFFRGSAELGGELAATAVPVAKAGQIIGKGGNAIMAAVRGTPAIAGAAPALSAAGNFAAGNGGLLSRMANLGAQGAAGGALLSGGGQDASLLQQMGVGGALGAAIPFGAQLLKGGATVGQALTRPFTETGRQNIANKIVADEAVAAGGIPDAVIPYAAPGQTPARFTPGPTPIPDAVIPYAAPGQTPARFTPGPTPIPGGPPPAPATPTLATSVDDILGKASNGGKLAANFNEIIPGSRPTLSQATGNAGIATFERGMAQRSTEAANAFNELQQANNVARSDFFDGLRGNAQTLEQAIAQREETAIPLLKDALAGAGKADTAPVMSTIRGIMSSAAGQRDAVKAALKPVIDKLSIGQKFTSDPLIPGTKVPAGVNGNGLQYDVNQLYGIRKSINDQLEKVSGRDNSVSQLASRELIQVRKSLDSAIEDAAPGFKDYLAQYATLSKPITSQSYLQGLDLTDQTSSAFTLQKVKKAVDRIEKARKAPGANEAKDLSAEQMDGLYRLHADLRREANSALGRVKGSSDTNQLLRQNNLLDVMLGGAGGKVASAAPATIGTGLGLLIGGPAGGAMGGVIGQNVGSIAGRAISSKAPAVEANLLQMLTNPGGAESLNALRQQTGESLLNRLMNKGVGVGLNRGTD